MRRTLLAAFALLTLGLAPLVQAGTPDHPEVEDSAEDGGVTHLDIRRLWIDTNDTLNLTFHLEVAGDLPSPQTATSACPAAGCLFASLTYRIIFRVEDAEGTPLPDVPAYNRSYVAYRHGPGGNLTAPIGTYDDAEPEVLKPHGQANVTVDGANVTLRIPRSNPAVNMQPGPTPGARIARLYGYDSPQLCSTNATVGCVPLAKPGASGQATSEWDRAPDQGFANASFPSPPPLAPSTNSSVTSTSAAPRPATAPTPPPPQSQPASAPDLATPAQPPPPVDGATRGASSLPVALLALTLLAALVVRRGRL